MFAGKDGFEPPRGL